MCGCERVKKGLPDILPAERMNTVRADTIPAKGGPPRPASDNSAAGHRFAMPAAVEMRRRSWRRREGYFKWLDTSLVISNIDTCLLPPKICRSFSSALISRLLTASCNLFFLM